MKSFTLLTFTALTMLPLSSFAIGNGDYFCRSQNTEFTFHTALYGSLAVAENARVRDLDLKFNSDPKYPTGVMEFFPIENHPSLQRKFVVSQIAENTQFPYEYLETSLSGDIIYHLERGTCESEK